MTSSPSASSYPPEPWQLSGQLVLLFWPMPADIMIDRLPKGLTPATRRGRTLVGTAWVDYQPGGILTYRELLVAVPVLHGLRPAACITDIWVDSPASQAGGRRLWGIPKDLADFPTFDGRHFSASTIGPGARPIAEATWTPRHGLPGRWPLRYSTVHLLRGRLARSRVRSVARFQAGSATMSVDPAGPLGYFAEHQPTHALALRDFELTFGG